MINCRIVQPMCETNLCFIRALPNGQNIPEFSRIVLFYRWQVISSKLKIDIRDGNAFYCLFFPPDASSHTIKARTVFTHLYTDD